MKLVLCFLGLFSLLSMGSFAHNERVNCENLAESLESANYILDCIDQSTGYENLGNLVSDAVINKESFDKLKGLIIFVGGPEFDSPADALRHIGECKLMDDLSEYSKLDLCE